MVAVAESATATTVTVAEPTVTVAEVDFQAFTMVFAAGVSFASFESAAKDVEDVEKLCRNGFSVHITISDR